jgi:hypothetical protein
MAAMPVLAAPVVPPDNTDYSKSIMSALAKAIMSLFTELWCKAFPDECPTKQMETHEDAVAFLRDAVYTAKIKLGRADAVKGQIHEQDWTVLLQAIAEEMKKKKQR